MSLKLMSVLIPANALATKREDAKAILSGLLQSVQQCQKRYGGKTELATEFDNCVAALCLNLEAVFLHGLRVKPLESEHSSALKQVSNIVTNHLHLNSLASFWPFLKQHLTKHEKERFEVLKHIWTDVGRGRAWIRSSLNERSLERNLHTVLSNQKLLKIYYEDWALLRDDEKNSMLPNMAAGLGSILFAVSINKPELNSEIVHKAERLQTLAEPIIEAPIREPSGDRKHKRRRKIAKQIISFDEEDSVLSSSIPSTSELHGKIQLKMDQNKKEAKMRLEESGSSEKFSNSVEGNLMPVEHNNVGQLTPIFTAEQNVIEVPTDISAVLTAVESRSKEEITKLQERISLLTKDNECLKDQVTKYVSAIKMLKTDEDVHKSLESLDLDANQRDYKSEAKVFEEKLVQVAEMHAELMDFNTYLQKTLLEKEKAIEQMKRHLEELKGPLTIEELSDNNQGSVNVWVPSAFLTGTGSDVHHVYQVFLRAGSDEWNIYRRYAQFHSLHSDLKKLDPIVSTFDFPPKKSIGNKDSAVVETRRKKLQYYLRRVLSHWPELAHCNSRFLLEQHLAFFKDDKSNDGKFPNNATRSVSSDNHYTGL